MEAQVNALKPSGSSEECQGKFWGIKQHQEAPGRELRGSVNVCRGASRNVRYRLAHTLSDVGWVNNESNYNSERALNKCEE